MCLYRIEARFFVAGLVVNKTGRVIRAAPIIRYMTGWNVAAVRAYCLNGNWKLEEVQ